MPSLRIISGELGGRVIKTPVKKILKPTPSRVREQLFSWIRPNLADTQCLDLFAGSGSLGFEAISNGANNCIFVEQNQELNFYLKNIPNSTERVRALRILKEAYKQLGYDEYAEKISSFEAN